MLMLTGAIFNLPWWVATGTKVILNVNPKAWWEWSVSRDSQWYQSLQLTPLADQRSSAGGRSADWNRMIGSWIWSHYLSSICYHHKQTDLCLLKGHLKTSWPEWTLSKYTSILPLSVCFYNSYTDIYSIIEDQSLTLCEHVVSKVKMSENINTRDFI